MRSKLSEQATILVVEDEDDIRHLIVETLEEADFKVLSAGDADQALSIARETNVVDILFTDVRLPSGMDGLELAAKLVQEGRCKVVIYATGYSYDPPKMVSPSIIFRKPYSLPSIATAARKMVEVARTGTGFGSVGD